MRRSSAVAALEAIQSAPEASNSPGRAPEQGLRTEFSFLLPRGYVDAAGTVHRDGVMRLAARCNELRVFDLQQCLLEPNEIIRLAVKQPPERR